MPAQFDPAAWEALEAYGAPPPSAPGGMMGVLESAGAPALNAPQPFTAESVAQSEASRPQPFGGGLPSTQTADQVEMIPAGLDYVAGQVATPKPPVTPNARQLAAQKEAARGVALASDAPGFAEQGGVVKSREELSKLQGGVLHDQAEGYLADREAAKVAQGREAQKQAVLAELADKNAKEYFAEADSIDRNARNLITAQRKRAEELANRHIDPHRGFNNMGTMSKVMWVLSLMAASQTKNSTQNMGMLMNAAEGMINRDIQAQKSDLDNQYKGLENQKAADESEYKLDQRGLTNLATQQEVRYKLIERALDAKIASMGNQAAERAGLLKVKAALGEQVFKLQSTFQTQIQGEAESAKARANAVYLKRLEHAHAKEMKGMELEETRRKEDKETNEKLGERGILIGPKSGLVATDTTGKTVADDTIIRARSPKDAVLAQEKTANGNKIYGLLKSMRSELDNMSETEIAAKHYTPMFRARQAELSELIAKINNDKITDRDVVNGANQLAGVKLDAEGRVEQVIDVALTKGDTVEGIRKLLDSRLASIPTQITDQIGQHLDARDAQQIKLGFKPTDPYRYPSEDKPSLNEINAQHGGDVIPTTPRPPLAVGQADALLKSTGPASAAHEASYTKLKATGKLPRLADAKEAEILTTARASFDKTTPESIKVLEKTFSKNLKTDEARFQLAMEARIAFKEASQTQKDIAERLAKIPSSPVGASLLAASDEDLPKYFNTPSKKYTADEVRELPLYKQRVAQFLKSDAYKELRAKYGLVRDLED